MHELIILITLIIATMFGGVNGLNATSYGAKHQTHKWVKDINPTPLPLWLIDQLKYQVIWPQLSTMPDTFTIDTITKMKYRVLRKGDKTQHRPREDELICAYYVGWLNRSDGPAIFDSSYEREHNNFYQPFYDARTKDIFYPNQVLEGLKVAFTLMHPGEIIEVELPPSMGYCGNPPPGIPDYLPLHFILELKSVYYE